MYTCHSHISKALTNGTISCVGLVRHYLKQIERHRHLNAFIEVYSSEALAKAESLDQKLASQPKSVGKLFGMVTAIKDVICYKDHEINAASKILTDFKSLYSATAVERLEAEDAIIIGRLNCDEFGMGSTNEHSVHGATLNGANTNHVPGGSSGASAVAVQAGCCLTALGTDTGGSVRQPAAFCGVVGLKPSYGRISRHGLIAYASSFDQIGILAKTVEDAALLLEVMAGKDEHDSTVSTKEVSDYSRELIFEGKAKIAYFEAAFQNESLDSEIKQQSIELVEKWKTAGHQVAAVDFDLMDYLIPAYYVLTTAEASSNLSRYDGIRYGHRSEAAENFSEVYTKSRSEGFGKEVKRRIMLGTYVLSAGYYDAYFGKAQKIRGLIKQRFDELFENYDFVVMPTTPTTAFRLGEQLEDPVAMYLSDVYTVPANLAGLPAINIPLAVHSNGLPYGIQLMAKPFDESRLLAFSRKTLTEFVTKQ